MTNFSAISFIKEDVYLHSKRRLVVNILYVAIASAKSCRQFSVKMLLLSQFLGTIGLSDEKFAVSLPIK